jgi:hypothetical protein
VITIVEVHEAESNRPLADLSAAPSNAWRRAFDSVILWAKNPERHPNPGVDGGEIGVPEAVRQGQFTARGAELRMRLLPGATWHDVQGFIENVAMSFANQAAGD